MNNKKIGNEFEKEFALWLANKNMFVYNLPNKINGQPFDILAVKNNIFYCFECKHCSSNYFRLSRVEDNQIQALKRLNKANTDNYYFVFKFESDDSIRFCKASYIEYFLKIKKRIHKDKFMKLEILELML